VEWLEVCGLICAHQLFQDLNDEEIANVCLPALGSLKSRGPDSGGYKVTNGTYLGHTRLSVIDVLHRSDQPFKIGDFHIIFNGELINYHECKANLKSKGYVFTTNSDTEVLLCLYIEYRERMLDICEGMYAFVVFNSKTKELFAARDRYGIKPLFYIESENIIAIASTMKSLYSLKLKENFDFNRDKLNEFFIFSYVTGKNTLVNSIKRLEPGCYCIKKNERLDVVRYHNPLSINTTNHYTKNEFQEVISKTFSQWSMSDVDTSLLLSGGLDSTLIALLYKNNPHLKETFTFVDKDLPVVNGINEGLNARKTAKKLGLKNNAIYREWDLERFKGLAYFSDEPMADLNSFTADSLIESVRNKNIKVAFCGEGADEIFGGYDRHFYCYKKYLSTGNDDFLKYGMNHLSLNHLHNLNECGKLNISERESAVECIKSKDDIFTGMLMYDQAFFLQSRLNTMDTVGGINGVEVRTPFVDRRIIDVANMYNYMDKTEEKFRKKIIYKMFEGAIPSHISMSVKGKLKPSISSSMNNPAVMEYFQDSISSGDMDNYFSKKVIMNYVDRFKRGDKSYTTSLSRLLSLSLWMDSFSQ
jgi:asparagine synthase (glutamine-hydrolysing)